MEQLTGAIATIFIVLLLLNILWKALLPELLRWRGVLVEGEVIDRETRWARRTIYFLRYSYDYNGKTYAHNQRVDEDTYHIWGDGGNAEVRCLPMLPIIAHLEV